jgi:hypothetical protein
MTTIAYDGRYLAADRREICSGLVRSMTKIFVFDSVVYAACGQIPDVLRIVEWLNSGYEVKERPTLQEGGGWGLVIRKGATRTVHQIQGNTPVLHRLTERFCADGSGRDFALAAMALGKSARDAVELASLFDASTGGGVDVFDVKEGRFTEVGDPALLAT